MSLNSEKRLFATLFWAAILGNLIFDITVILEWRMGWPIPLRNLVLLVVIAVGTWLLYRTNRKRYGA